MAPRVAVAATTILAQLLAPLFCPFAARPQILSPLTACACVVSFAILRRSLAAGAFASAISCRCLLAGSQGRVGGFLGWIAGTLARARAPGYGSGHKPAWFLRAPRGAKGGTGVSTGDGGFNHLYFSATCRYSSTVSFTRFLGPVAGPSRRRDPVGQPGAPPLLPSGGAPVISGPVKINYFLAIYS